jgi:hypothetical protein
MRWNWRNPFDTPTDSRLTVRAGLYLKSVPGLGADPEGRGPDRFTEGGSPRGALGFFVNSVGPVWGWLDFMHEGLRWRPMPRTSRWGYRAFEIPWQQLAGLDGAMMWMRGGVETLLRVSTQSDDVLEFTVPHDYKGRITELLEEYLERETPGWGDPPFAI